MRDAAQRVFAQENPLEPVDDMSLVQVVDKPGTEADQAVFNIRSGGRDHRIVLGRHGDDWTAA
jgi:hypothetical protein